MLPKIRAIVASGAMVTAFAVLPAMSASAVEPLEDGAYQVVIADQTYTVTVTDGQPIHDGDRARFLFAFDDESGRVLSAFNVIVDDAVYDVEVADGGAAVVTPMSEVDDEPTEADLVTDEATEADDEPTEVEDTESEDDDVDSEDADDSGDADDSDADDSDEVDDPAHGDFVSRVSACAPRGREARELGLPNHGAFVSSAARGDSLTFDWDGGTWSHDFADGDADAACAAIEELVAAAEALRDEPAPDAEAPADDPEPGDDAEEKAQGRDKDKSAKSSNGNANGHDKAEKKDGNGGGKKDA